MSQYTVPANNHDKAALIRAGRPARDNTVRLCMPHLLRQTVFPLALSASDIATGRDMMTL